MAREDTIGKWSEDKLSLLGKYLSAYVAVLKNQKWCKGYEYIDGFAGSGRPKSRHEERFVNGSPRIALQVEPPFTHYHFIETSGWRVQKLQSLRAEFPEHTITVHRGDCNQVIVDELLPTLPKNAYKRAIAFLDPFGMQLKWSTIEAIGNTKTVEIMLNFSVMAINRNVRRPNEQSLTPATRQRMDTFWGTEWETDIYTTEQTLFGEENVLITQSARELGARFRKRLSQVFPHSAVPLLMTNSRNAPLYCLLFAGHNETGARIANDIFAGFQRMG